MVVIPYLDEYDIIERYTILSGALRILQRPGQSQESDLRCRYLYRYVLLTVIRRI